jgi:hypothetical protein
VAFYWFRKTVVAVAEVIAVPVAEVLGSQAD